MVKKTVKLVAQERFDLIDALALQQGTLDYLASALGNLMGQSSGLLSELTLDISTASKVVTFNDKFSFFITKPTESIGNRDGTGYTGEVVLYDPQNPAQAMQSVDYTATKNAKDSYFDNGSLDALGEDASDDSRLLQAADFAPFLWARPVQVEGQLDARRKWSVAQQSEVPVTMNTRTITAVEFSLSASMPEYSEGTSPWAPIAKIVSWNNDYPVFLRISAFDTKKWGDRSDVPTLGDIDSNTPGTQKDWFSQASANLSSWNIFERYNRVEIRPNVAVSTVFNLLVNARNYTPADEGGPVRSSADLGILADLRLLNSWLVEDDTRTLEQAGISEQARSYASRPWNKAIANSSNGLVDQLSAIKTVIQNVVGDGVFDHGTSLSARYEKLAPFENNASSYSTIFEKLAGKFQSHWTAKPFRSINSLALENMTLKDAVKRLRRNLDIKTVDIALLTQRVEALEQYESPFANVPISDASPLVPALSMTFKANYGPSRSGFKCYAGPAGATRDVEFFIHANAYSQISYARGGVRITLSEDCVQSMGGPAAIDNGQVVIQATPVHFADSNCWLYPHGSYAVGRVDNQTTHEGGSDSYKYQGESLAKFNPDQVLNAFANFYQCTLNVFIRKQNNVYYIEVYPVNTVPDIIEQGQDLRGYPSFGGWVGRVSSDAEDIGTWSDAARVVEGNVNNDVYANGTAYGYLHGDVTNPDIYRSKTGGSDVSDGNFLSGAAVFTKDDIFGKEDDLRGFAQSITFLRPDRFSIRNTALNTFNIAAERFDARHNAPETHLIDDGSDVNAPNFGDLENDPGRVVRSFNGRFMPSFSLVAYKNTFTGLGTGVNVAPVFREMYPGNNMSIEYNDSSVFDENGNITTTGDTSTRGGS